MDDYISTSITHLPFFRSECEVIEKLLKADVCMAQWRFVTALLHLQDAHNKIMLLMNHSNSLTTKDTWGKLSFLGMKAPSMPVLYVWLKQYKDAIYSKVYSLCYDFVFVIFLIYCFLFYSRCIRYDVTLSS